MTDLQSQLDAITAQTRQLVQPEKLAITEAGIAEVLATGVEDRMLRPGAQAPDFVLPAASATALHQAIAPNGKVVRSTDLLSLGPVVLKFFRGRWDPYCTTELETWQELYPEVRKRGALLVAISPQLPRQNDFMVQQHHFTFPMLSDGGCKVAESFGIAYTLSETMQRHYRSIFINLPFVNGDASGKLPLPATFLVGQDGVLRYAEGSADHRVRPEPEAVLALL